AADVLPLWIELLALGHGIEHSKVGGCVNPRTCAPLPAHVICGVVAVCEMFEIVALATAGVGEQVLREETRADHAGAIRDEAFDEELPLRRIDNRVTSGSVLPREP